MRGKQRQAISMRRTGSGWRSVRLRCWYAPCTAVLVLVLAAYSPGIWADSGNHHHSKALVVVPPGNGLGDIFDPFAILGVARDTPPEQIKRAYHAAIKQAHPENPKNLGKPTIMGPNGVPMVSLLEQAYWTIMAIRALPDGAFLTDEYPIIGVQILAKHSNGDPARIHVITQGPGDTQLMNRVSFDEQGKPTGMAAYNHSVQGDTKELLGNAQYRYRDAASTIGSEVIQAVFDWFEGHIQQMTAEQQLDDPLIVGLKNLNGLRQQRWYTQNAVSDELMQFLGIHERKSFSVVAYRQLMKNALLAYRTRSYDRQAVTGLLLPGEALLAEMKEYPANVNTLAVHHAQNYMLALRSAPEGQHLFHENPYKIFSDTMLLKYFSDDAEVLETMLRERPAYFFERVKDAGVWRFMGVSDAIHRQLEDMLIAGVNLTDHPDARKTARSLLRTNQDRQKGVYLHWIPSAKFIGRLLSLSDAVPELREYVGYWMETAGTWDTTKDAAADGDNHSTGINLSSALFEYIRENNSSVNGPTDSFPMQCLANLLAGAEGYDGDVAAIAARTLLPQHRKAILNAIGGSTDRSLQRISPRLTTIFRQSKQIRRQPVRRFMKRFGLY